MRYLFGFLIVVAIAAGVLKHSRNEKPAAPVPALAQAAKASSVPERENSQHNWPKNALDRAADVKKRVLQQRKEDGTR